MTKQKPAIDPDLIRELAQLLEETGLSEIEIERDGQTMTRDFEAKRAAIVTQLFAKLNGKLSEADKKYIEGAFRLLQNQILHGPISALDEAVHEGQGNTLMEALRKLFRLPE